MIFALRLVAPTLHRQLQRNAFNPAIVITVQADARAGQRPATSKALDAVRCFGCIAAMEPDTDLCTASIFGQGDTVGEYLHAIPALGLCVRVQAPAQAFFGQYPLYECQVAFTVLHAITAYMAAKEFIAALRPLPIGEVSM